MCSLKIECKNPTNGALEYKTVVDTGGGGWSSYYRSSNKYVCGANYFTGEITQCVLIACGTEFVGVAEASLRYCEYNCNHKLIFENNIPDTTFSINIPSSADHRLSSSRTYRQTSTTFGNFMNYFDNFEATGECSISCSAIEGLSTLTYSSPYSANNDIWLTTSNGVSL